jgi:hypothetical protein
MTLAAAAAQWTMTFGQPPAGPLGPPLLPGGPDCLCPVCGSNASVHAIQELAALAQLQLDRLHQAALMPPQPPGGRFRLIGRAIGRRVQRTVNEQVMPVMTERVETQARERIAIAQRHPDLRACFADQVAFLAGGSRFVPLPDLGQITMASADALVAQLRDQG